MPVSFAKPLMGFFPPALLEGCLYKLGALRRLETEVLGDF